MNKDLTLQPDPEILPPETILPDDMERADVPAIFNAFRTEIERLRQTAETITVTDVKDKAGMALANTTRLALWRISIAVEKRRKELKETALKRGQKIDAAAKEISEPLAALIKRLKEQEEFAEREAIRIEGEARTRRSTELSPYLTTALSVDLGKISEEEYSSILTGMKAAHEAKIEAARKAEEERIAKEKAEAEERERIKAERDRLQKEAAEKEAALAAERARVAEERRKEQATADAKLKAERERAAAEQRKADESAKAERDRLKAESDAREAEAAKARAAAEKKAREETAARKKLEDEKRAREVADAAVAKAAADKARKDAAAPDVDKLMAFADSVAAIPFPSLSQSSPVSAEIAEKRDAFVKWIKKQSKSLIS